MEPRATWIRGALLTTGLLRGLTIVGWVITLVVGPGGGCPVVRLRPSVRRAGVILLGYGLAYYVVGFPPASRSEKQREHRWD